MINEKHSYEQLPNELSAVISKLQLLKHLRKQAFEKALAFRAPICFKLVFCLIFHQKNWFALVTIKKSDSFPGKDNNYLKINYHIGLQVYQTTSGLTCLIWSAKVE